MAAVSPDDPTLLLVNPSARRGREAFDAVRERLSGRLNLAGALLPETPEQFDRALDTALQRGIRRFVVGGGDGTLSRAAGVLQGTDGVLAVLPLGTGNTFAHGLGLPARLDDLLAVAVSGRVERYDVGEVSGAAGHRAFLNSVTIGISEHLAALLTPEAKRRLGWLAWPLALHRALRATPAVHVALSYAPGGREAYPTRQLIIANGRTIAGPIAATPHASGQDGRLEVFSLGGPPVWASLRLGVRAVLGRRMDEAETHYHICTEVRLESRPAVRLDVDGDIWGDTPVDCRVRPAALRVLLPDRPEGAGLSAAVPPSPVERQPPAAGTGGPLRAR